MQLPWRRRCWWCRIQVVWTRACDTRRTDERSFRSRLPRRTCSRRRGMSRLPGTVSTPARPRMTPRWSSTAACGRFPAGSRPPDVPTWSLLWYPNHDNHHLRFSERFPHASDKMPPFSSSNCFGRRPVCCGKVTICLHIISKRWQKPKVLITSTKKSCDLFIIGNMMHGNKKFVY